MTDQRPLLVCPHTLCVGGPVTNTGSFEEMVRMIECEGSPGEVKLQESIIYSFKFRSTFYPRSAFLAP